MAMGKGTSYNSVSGNSMYYPQEKGFTPTFWGNGWNQTEETLSPGKMEKGGTASASKGGKTGSKMGKCPFCG